MEITMRRILIMGVLVFILAACVPPIKNPETFLSPLPAPPAVQTRAAELAPPASP